MYDQVVKCQCAGLCLWALFNYIFDRGLCHMLITGAVCRYFHIDFHTFHSLFEEAAAKDIALSRRAVGDGRPEPHTGGRKPGHPAGPAPPYGMQLQQHFTSMYRYDVRSHHVRSQCWQTDGETSKSDRSRRTHGCKWFASARHYRQ